MSAILPSETSFPTEASLPTEHGRNGGGETRLEPGPHLGPLVDQDRVHRRVTPGSIGPDAGTIVGASSLADIDVVNEHAHIGWTGWDPRVWAGAVNPEAKLLMLTEAFDHGFGRVKLQADSHNERSRAAILKLGATQEGIFRKHMIMADGHVRDSVYFSIIDSDWPAVKAGLEKRLAAAAG